MPRPHDDMIGRVARGRPVTFPIAASLALALATAVILLLRLPAAFRGFNDAAAAEVGRNDLGGALAAADAVGLNNDFVRAGFVLIPMTGHFAVVLPDDLAQAEKTYGVNPITFDAAPTLLEDFLMPRRVVAKVTPGTFILCYFCDSPYWDQRTRWLSNNHAGGLVGYVYRR